MTFRALLFVFFIGFAAVATSAQQPAPPAAPGQPAQPSRTPPRATRPGEDPQKGTAVMRGYVTAADTGNPLRRAMVRVTSQDGRSSNMVTTDANGRFEIKDLLAGRYNLSATKASYVTMSYGQRRPEQQGTLLEILDGQTVEKIAFPLPRGGVVTGKVLDEFGEPVAGAQVSAMRFRYINGARRLSTSGSSGTDDLGAFRVFGLAPGEYYISGTLRTQGGMVVVNGVAAPGAADGYAVTYFPGTPNVAEATRLTVKPAQETANIMFSLTAARLARLSGRAVSSSGEPVIQGFVSAMPVDRFAGGFMSTSGTTRADGTFFLNGLAPGTYNVMLRPRTSGGNNNPEFANVRVTIGNDDVDNVLLVAARGAIARGVITTDENIPLPVRTQQLYVGTRPIEPDVMIRGGGMEVRDDWTFEITGLADRQVVTASIAENPDWSLKSVMLHGQDIIDTPIEFIPGQTVEGLQIVFSRKRTDLSGAIAGDRGAPVTDATVIVFSENPERWGYATRYVRTARPSQDGRYSLKGLPPHDYLVVAVTDIETGQWQDPEFLERVRAQAVRVSLGDGETKVQDLKVARQ